MSEEDPSPWDDHSNWGLPERMASNTPEDQDAAKAFATQYIAENNPQNVRTPDEFLQHYLNARGSGIDHDQAVSRARDALGWWPQSGAQDANAAQPTAAVPGGGGGDYYGGQTSGQGLFDPGLYAPFQGRAPSYSSPTLPNAPNFDSYYNASDYPTAHYNAPTMRQAPAFEAGKFSAPTLEEAQNQPGYKFGVEQGEKALQQSRASQGLLRTGDTLKDILDYGRNAATQNYGNVFNQNLGVFKTNEAGRVGAYNTNYGTQYKDPNDYDLINAQSAFQGQLGANRQGLDVAQARFAPAMLQYQTDAANAQRQAELGYNADWAKYQDSENVFYANQNSPFSKYLSLAQLGSQYA